MLIKRSNKKTRYILPVMIKNTTVVVNWYYDTEYLLFSAFRQLKVAKIGVIPLTPVIA